MRWWKLLGRQKRDRSEKSDLWVTWPITVRSPDGSEKVYEPDPVPQEPQERGGGGA